MNTWRVISKSLVNDCCHSFCAWHGIKKRYQKRHRMVWTPFDPNHVWLMNSTPTITNTTSACNSSFVKASMVWLRLDPPNVNAEWDLQFLRSLSLSSANGRFSMNLWMFDQAFLPGSAVVTYITFEWLFTGVNSYMAGQTTLQSSGVVTQIAFKLLFAGVNS